MSLINEALKHAEREKLTNGQHGKYSSDVHPNGESPNRPYDMRQLLLPAGIVLVIVCWTAWSAIRPGVEGGGKGSIISAAMAGPAYKTISRTPDASASLAHHKSLNAVKYFRPAPVKVVENTTKNARVLKTPSVKEVEVKKVSAPLPSAPTFDPDKFKLSGIMSGPGGKIAVINGHSIHTGETIGQAKVINIGTRSVILELADQRITIRM